MWIKLKCHVKPRLLYFPFGFVTIQKWEAKQKEERNWSIHSETEHKHPNREETTICKKYTATVTVVQKHLSQAWVACLPCRSLSLPLTPSHTVSVGSHILMLHFPQNEPLSNCSQHLVLLFTLTRNGLLRVWEKKPKKTSILSRYCEWISCQQQEMPNCIVAGSDLRKTEAFLTSQQVPSKASNRSTGFQGSDWSAHDVDNAGNTRVALLI